MIAQSDEPGGANHFMQFSRISCVHVLCQHLTARRRQTTYFSNQDCGCAAADPPRKVRGSLWVGLGPSVGWHTLLIVWYRAGRPGALLVDTVLLSLALASLAAVASLLVQVLTHLVAVQSHLVLGS